MSVGPGELRVGERGRVIGYQRGDRSYREKLLSMGLTSGTEFSVIRLAPLGDPGCHTFRATGITISPKRRVLEKAQMMAAHESPKTTKLYDRTSDVVSLDEVERVVF